MCVSPYSLSETFQVLEPAWFVQPSSHYLNCTFCPLMAVPASVLQPGFGKADFVSKWKAKLSVFFDTQVTISWN